MSDQQDLFGSPPPPERLKAAVAATRRDLGIERARRRAGDPWTMSAARFVAYYARAIAKGEPFLIEDARAAWNASGREPPPDGRAWGGVTNVASRELGLIEKAGYGPAKSSNCSPKVLWRAKVRQA